ncbi:MAG: two pore domain potassium channel family protein [Acidobacteria bacterium]|nr:two pore domain potassium channel family protein [Acidobacteriota bacterium]
MKTIISTAAGVGLLLFIIYDVYATVLHSSARYGPIGESLNRAVWRLARTIAFRLPRMHRHKFLNLVGPLLMPFLLLTYIVLLINAFALIYYPHLQSSFVISREVAGTGFANALYFSGLTLTTVGYGDIVPHTTPMRFTAIFEAAFGIIAISLAITYLLTVYGALEHKRIAALALYHQAGEGADAAGFIAHHYVEGKFYGLRSALSTATRDLQALLESHVEHPVIHYFHPAEVYKSLPRMLFLLLESCSIIQTSLDSEENSDLRNYPEVRTLEASTRHVLNELVASLDIERRERKRRETPAEANEDDRRWHRRYRQTIERLTASGIVTRRDLNGGWEEYRAQRQDWESKLQRLSIHLGYDWDEITGDRDLDYAADEEKAKPQG